MNISPIRFITAGQNVYGGRKSNGLNKGVNNTGRNVNTSPAFGAVIGNTVDLKAQLDVYVNLAKRVTPDEIREMVKIVEDKIHSIYRDRYDSLQSIEELPKLVQKFKKGKINKIEEKFVSEYIALTNEKKKLLDMLEESLDNIKRIEGGMRAEIDRNKTGTVSVSKALKAEAQAKYAAYSQHKGFDAIAGYEYEKAILDKFFISEMKNERAGKDAKVPGSILFFGPQGNGKTSFAKAFAQEADARVEYIDANGTRSKEKDRFHTFLDELYDAAKQAEEHYQKEGKNQRTILIVDEFDNVAGKNSTITKELEKFLQTCSDKYHCTVFATTNYPERIAMNLKKENSAFPYRVALDPPTAANKARVLEFYTKGRDIESINIPAAVKKIEEKEKENGALFNNSYIKKMALQSNNQEELIRLIESTKPSITKDKLDIYSKAVVLLTEGKAIL